MTKEERNDAIEFFKKVAEYSKLTIEALEQKSSNDMVSRGVFEQVMWERNVAIDQLKELGYGLGEKPKTGHWIYKQYGSYPEQGDYHCSECDGIDNRIPAYCPNCGAKMQEVDK